MHLELRLPLCNSLKEKRGLIRPALNHARKTWNVSTAEVGLQDQWRGSILAFCAISNDRSVVENTLRQIADYFYTINGVETIDTVSEIV